MGPTSRRDCARVESGALLHGEEATACFMRLRSGGCCVDLGCWEDERALGPASGSRPPHAEDGGPARVTRRSLKWEFRHLWMWEGGGTVRGYPRQRTSWSLWETLNPSRQWTWSMETLTPPGSQPGAWVCVCGWGRSQAMKVAGPALRDPR